MMNANHILTKIYKHKVMEVDRRKKHQPARLLEESHYFSRDTISLKHHIRNTGRHGIIAEFKTQSPSLGVINEHARVAEVTKGYIQAGASALSVLTDEHFFGGSFQNLQKARDANHCPILQKDFVLDTYQIMEAKAYGADAILLIAAMLSKEKILELSSFADSLGLEILFEIHEREELDKITEHIQLVGINNRNLKNFSVNQKQSLDLVGLVPNGLVKIAESGIDSPMQAVSLLNNGFDGLLIGGKFMKHPHPDKACRDFIHELNKTLF